MTRLVVKTPAPQQEQNGGDEEGGDTGYQGDFGQAGYTTKIYDSEVRFFYDQLDRGKHEVSFLFRTTTPGVYPTPPTRAELMYQPEVTARTAADTIEIQPR